MSSITKYEPPLSRFKKALKKVNGSGDNSLASTYIPETEYSLYKRQSIEIAKELRYGRRVIRKLEIADSVAKIQRILTSARRGELD